ncbi:ABC transporter permease [Breoghania sp. L-A4]|uniref:ABC transporter permease n=1 Tax=Breoghania sp. L-A4 TaxID=2304600 RepID=UPI000E35CFBD|nr:ABC transporter permease [Breoghania sp. L-A4]AXS41520.1 ABC transporter permease [Breoghania sp. L-A4]
MTWTERIARALVWVIGVAVSIYLMAPLFVTIAVSFSDSSVFNLPPPSWSLRWYEALAHKRGFLPALGLSVQIALISTGISLVFGTLAAIAVVRGRFPGREAISTFVVSPLMMPGLVIGIALLQFLREIGFRDAYTGLILGHVIVTLPFVMRTVQASLSLFDFTLIDAARTLGLSYPRALIKVLVPVLSPAYLSSGLFAFLASMDNYPISIFLTDARNKTLPIQILEYLEVRPDPTIAAISSLLILLTIIVLLISDRLVGLRRMADF